MNIKTMWNYIYQSLPIIIPLGIWIVRLEGRLTKIETNITWIKREME